MDENEDGCLLSSAVKPFLETFIFIGLRGFLLIAASFLKQKDTSVFVSHLT